MKKATLALALGLLIGSATTAIAATDTVQATIAKFKFVVNGEQQQLKNDPLVRNGVTYLPVRETAELLGAQVDFKDGTITLVKDGETVTETVTQEWISFTQLMNEYNVMIVVGEEISIADTLVFPRPDGREEGIHQVQTSAGTFHIKVDNGRVFVVIDEMRELGII